MVLIIGPMVNKEYIGNNRKVYYLEHREELLIYTISSALSV